MHPHRRGRLSLLALTLGATLCLPSTVVQALPSAGPDAHSSLPSYRWQPYPMPRTTSSCKVDSATPSGKALVMFEPFGGGITSVLSSTGEQRLRSTSTRGVAYDTIWPDMLADDATVHGTVVRGGGPQKRTDAARWLPDGTLTTLELPPDEGRPYNEWRLAAVTPTGDAVWVQLFDRPATDPRPSRVVWKRDGSMVPLDAPKDLIPSTLDFSTTGDAVGVTTAKTVIRKTPDGVWKPLLVGGTAVAAVGVGISPHGHHLVTATHVAAAKQILITHLNADTKDPVTATLPVGYVDVVRVKVSDDGTALLKVSANGPVVSRGTEVASVQSRVTDAPPGSPTLSYDSAITSAGTVATHTQTPQSHSCEYGVLIPVATASLPTHHSSRSQ